MSNLHGTGNGRSGMTRRAFSRMVARLAKNDGLTAAPRKAAVLHALRLWDGENDAGRAELVRMLGERLDGKKTSRPPRREDDDG